MELLGVHHVALKARDVRRTAAFYREVLGLEEIDRHHDDGKVRSIWLRCGGVIIMVERSEVWASGDGGPTEPDPFDPPGLHLLALTIAADARPSWARRLAELGHPVTQETDFTMYIRDPEGNRVGLSTWPVRSRGGVP